MHRVYATTYASSMVKNSRIYILNLIRVIISPIFSTPLILRVWIKEEIAQEAYSDTHTLFSSSVYPRKAKVYIQDLRETEWLYLRSQAVLERQREEQRQRSNAIRLHQVRHQVRHRVTDNFKNKYRSASSRPRWIEIQIYINYNTIATICYY